MVSHSCYTDKSRMEYRRKIFHITLIILVVLAFTLLYQKQSYKTHINYPKRINVKGPKVYNVLMWTHKHTEPFNFFKPAMQSFEGCYYTNCYITNEREYMDILEWDAILFHAPEYTWIQNPWNHGRPQFRRKEQIYIFVSIESSANYPVVSDEWDGYFNWTMTYKLDSDVPWLYLNTRDSQNNVVGPAADVAWIKDDIITKSLKDGLKNKTKAVAWLVSNCNTQSKRETYANALKQHLEKLNLSLDIYGRCGSLKCPLNNKQKCWRYLEQDYYFYLSFENSFSVDYVTEKLLHAVQHNTVPIVWGGADYRRFAPADSFINAREHSARGLAAIIQSLVSDLEGYSKYFTWRNRYSYQSSYDSPETSPFCKLCESLNTKSTKHKVYPDFRKWWNS